MKWFDLPKEKRLEAFRLAGEQFRMQFGGAAAAGVGFASPPQWMELTPDTELQTCNVTRVAK